MRIVYLLLHDFRFASLGIREFAFQGFHFSKEYARRMAAKGHDVKLYVLGDDVRGRLNIEQDGYELKAFRPSLRFPPFWGFGNDHSLEVLRELTKDAPDVVHFHNYYLWNFPYVSLWAKRTGSRLVGQYHGTDPIRSLKGAAFLPSLRLCDRLLVPIRKEEAFLTGVLHLPASKVIKIPSTGVDIETFHRVRAPDVVPTLLYVGRIPKPGDYREEKAPQHLVPILRALADTDVNARLVVAGDGPGLPALKDQAERLGLTESVSLLGQVRHSELPELYSRASITFVPLHLDEISPSWGGSVQESLACGTPVAGFNNESPGLSRLGVLLPIDPRRAAGYLKTVLSDEIWQSKVRNEASKAVSETCRWDTIIQRLNYEYDVICSRGR